DGLRGREASGRLPNERVSRTKCPQGIGRDPRESPAESPSNERGRRGDPLARAPRTGRPKTLLECGVAGRRQEQGAGRARQSQDARGGGESQEQARRSKEDGRPPDPRSGGGQAKLPSKAFRA